MGTQQIALHATVAKHSTLAIDVDIAKTVGFDAIELSGSKLGAYLEAGHDVRELKALLGKLSIPGVGYLCDVERQGADRDRLLNEASALFRLAALAGAGGVQVLTGPVDVRAVQEYRQFGHTARYRGLLGMDEAEQIKLTAQNLALLADLASDYGLTLYLESLAWAPINDIAKSLQLIKHADRGNLKLVIDYWHCSVSGVTPDEIARIDRQHIYGVHVCDGLPFEGGIPDEAVLRDVPTGSGVIDLQAWTDAVKATGYEGWWSCELFCRKQQQEDSYEVARSLKRLMEKLIG